jgi:hypothetical protein
MKFCMISGANFNGKMTGGYMNGVFDWVRVFDGEHRCIINIRDDKTVLNEYDVVLMVDADRYLDDAIQIATLCDCKTVFCPEATISAYTAFEFDHQKLFYELLSVVDLIGAFEEDRIQWYESLWDTPAFFMHTPISEEIVSGRMRQVDKEDRVLICCNLGMDKQHAKTNLITSLGVMRRVKHPCLLCEVVPDQIRFLTETMGIESMDVVTRLPWTDYTEHIVGPSKLMLNPSDMIGTSRNAIMGAACGTPVIGNMHSHTQARLFPKLSTYIYDVDKMAELIERLYSDSTFYQGVCDYAFEHVDHYSESNALKRFVEALDRIGVR